MWPHLSKITSSATVRRAVMSQRRYFSDRKRAFTFRFDIRVSMRITRSQISRLPTLVDRSLLSLTATAMRPSFRSCIRPVLKSVNTKYSNLFFVRVSTVIIPTVVRCGCVNEFQFPNFFCHYYSRWPCHQRMVGYISMSIIHYSELIVSTMYVASTCQAVMLMIILVRINQMPVTSTNSQSSYTAANRCLKMIIHKKCT